MSRAEVWIMSCGPVFEGMSTNKKEVRKHVRLCFVGTKAEVMRKLDDMRRKARFFERCRPSSRKGKKNHVVIYVAGKARRYSV